MSQTKFMNVGNAWTKEREDGTVILSGAIDYKRQFNPKTKEKYVVYAYPVNETGEVVGDAIPINTFFLKQNPNKTKETHPDWELTFTQKFL